MTVLEELTEEERVVEWREWRLTQAGLPPLVALSLARERGLDIEQACKVVVAVLAAGKSYELAVEILL